MPKDDYLLKVGIDLDEVQLNAVTGKISDQLTQMGTISDDFIDNALATARKYNDEIEKQRKLIAKIDEQLHSGVDDKTRKLLEETKRKAKGIISDYTHGNKEKGLESKKVVDAIAEFAGNQRFRLSDHIPNKLKDAFGSAIGKVSKFSAVMGGAEMVIKSFVNKVGEALDNFSNYSNQLNPLGAFGNQNQRNLMSRYGMTGTQALGFANVLDAMGMSESDIGKMTDEQRRVFNSLNEFWNEGIGKIDPEKLERFNKTMSEYQEIQAKFQMGLQMTIMKMVAESPRFEKMVGKVEDFMDVTLEFLGSPLVQNVFDGLISFLTTVVTILEKAMRLISIIPGFGAKGDTITNNTTNSNSTYNIYGADFKSNDELARQISFSNQGGYRG